MGGSKMRSIIISLSFVLSLVMVVLGHGPRAYGQSQSEPVVLDDLGPSSVVQPPSGVPVGWRFRQKEYLIRNLSSQDIVFYVITYVNERGSMSGSSLRASYPPERPPLIAAGANERITRRYTDN